MLVVPIAIFLLVVYVLTRQGWYRLAGRILVVYVACSVFVLATLVGGLSGMTFLYYLIAAFVLSGILLSTRSTMVAFVLMIGGVILSPLFISGITLDDVLAGPASFNIIIAIIILLTTFYRQRFENQQRSQLAASERRYRSLIENMRDIVYVHDMKGRLISINAVSEKLTGWTRNEVLGHSFKRFVHSDDIPVAMMSYEKALCGETLALIELRVLCKSGEYRSVEFKSTPQYEDGKLVSFLGVGRDVTERRQEEAQKLKSMIERERWSLINRFVLAVSHDFRTSLATIETSRYLIQRRLPDDMLPVVEPKLATIKTYVDRMAEQLENLYIVYSLNEPQIVPLNLNLVLEQAILRQHRIVKDKCLAVNFVPEVDAPLALADEEKVTIALKHLLSNALTYTPYGGPIWICTRHTATQVVVDIRDSGPGISDTDLPHIFDLFYRADPARTLDSGGVGLGLSIVKMIADAHNGTITVNSKLGEGSTFTLALPTER
jgi:PAS domain S-box-containing protein